MLWIILAAFVIAVAILGFRNTLVGLALLLGEALLGIASLWLLGAFFYVAAIALTVGLFALLVWGFVALLGYRGNDASPG